MQILDLETLGGVRRAEKRTSRIVSATLLLVPGLHQKRVRLQRRVLSTLQFIQVEGEWSSNELTSTLVKKSRLSLESHETSGLIAAESTWPF